MAIVLAAVLMMKTTFPLRKKKPWQFLSLSLSLSLSKSWIRNRLTQMQKSLSSVHPKATQMQNFHDFFKFDAFKFSRFFKFVQSLFPVHELKETHPDTPDTLDTKIQETKQMERLVAQEHLNNSLEDIVT
jgi:hypothetical protein